MPGASRFQLDGELDRRFVAAVEVDLARLGRSKAALARALTEKLPYNIHTLTNRLSRNGLPKQLEFRKPFLDAVQVVLNHWYDEARVTNPDVGFPSNYDEFIGDSGKRPVVAGALVLRKKVDAYLSDAVDRADTVPDYFPPWVRFDRVRQLPRLRERRRGGATSPEDMDAFERGEVGIPAAGPGRDRHRETPPLPWYALLPHLRGMLIVAPPGSGKTTLAQLEAARVAGEARAALAAGHTVEQIGCPFWLNASDLARRLPDHNSLTSAEVEEALVAAVADRVAEGERLVRWLTGRLREPSTTVIVDGLDQVVSPLRERLQIAIRTFSEATAARLICTVRAAGVWRTFPLIDKSDAVLELAPFDRFDINRFVEAWFEHETSGREAVHDALLDPRVASLAANPLLLSLICFIASSTQSLPARRAELFEAVFRLILERPWHPAPRAESEIEQLIEIAQALAFRLVSSGWVHEASGDTLNQTLRAVLGQTGGSITSGSLKEAFEALTLSSGLLSRRGVGEIGRTGEPYRFLVQGLQEYLIARELSKQGSSRYLAVVRPHFSCELNWAEVTAFLAGLLVDASPLFEALLNEPDDAFQEMGLLAAKCLAESDVQEVAEILRARIIDRAIAVASSLFVDERAAAADVLLSLGKVAVRHIAPLAGHNRFEVRELAAGLLRRIGGRESAFALRMYYVVNDQWVYDFEQQTRDLSLDQRLHLLIHFLGTDWFPARADSDFLHGLREMLTSGDADTREASSRELLRLGGQQALGVFLEASMNSEPGVRRAAIESLAYFHDPRALNARGQALDDPHPDVRTAAMGCLDPRLPEDATRLRAALADPASAVRQAAIGRIQDSTEFFSEICNALGDSDDGVRFSAAFRLARRPQAEAVPALAQQFLQNVESSSAIYMAGALMTVDSADAREVLRSAARGAGWPALRVAQAWPGPVPSAAFAGRADWLLPELAHSQEPVAREVAFEALAHWARAGHWVEPRDVIATLLREALDDEEANVRAAAADPFSLYVGSAGPLRAALVDSDAAVRTAALQALRQCQDPQATSALRHAASHHLDPALRATAIRYLGEVGSDEDVTLLLTILQGDPQPAARGASADALAALASNVQESDAATLVAALKDSDPQVRHAVVGALRTLDLNAGAESEAAIEPLLLDEDEDVRAWSVEQFDQLPLSGTNAKALASRICDTILKLEKSGHRSAESTYRVLAYWRYHLKEALSETSWAEARRAIGEVQGRCRISDERLVRKEYLPSPKDFFDLLAQYGVRFVLIGKLAAALNGINARYDHAIEICPQDTSDNNARIVAALLAVDGRIFERVDDDEPGEPVTFELLSTGRRDLGAGIGVGCMARIGRIDLIYRPHGMEHDSDPYAVLTGEAHTATLRRGS